MFHQNYACIVFLDFFFPNQKPLIFFITHLIWIMFTKPISNVFKLLIILNVKYNIIYFIVPFHCIISGTLQYIFKTDSISLLPIKRWGNIFLIIFMHFCFIWNFLFFPFVFIVVVLWLKENNEKMCLNYFSFKMSHRIHMCFKMKYSTKNIIIFNFFFKLVSLNWQYCNTWQYIFFRVHI